MDAEKSNAWSWLLILSRSRRPDFVLLTVIFVDADAVIWFKHQGIILFCLCPGDFREKGKEKASTILKRKASNNLICFPTELRNKMFHLLLEWRCGLREAWTQSMFHNLKSQGVWGRSLNMGGLVGGTYLQKWQRNLPQLWQSRIFWMFSLNSRWERFLSPQINRVFEIEREKREPLDLAKTVLLTNCYSHFPTRAYPAEGKSGHVRSEANFEEKWLTK